MRGRRCQHRPARIPLQATPSAPAARSRRFRHSGGAASSARSAGQPPRTPRSVCRCCATRSPPPSLPCRPRSDTASTIAVPRRRTPKLRCPPPPQTIPYKRSLPGSPNLVVPLWASSPHRPYCLVRHTAHRLHEIPWIAELFSIGCWQLWVLMRPQVAWLHCMCR